MTHSKHIKIQQPLDYHHLLAFYLYTKDCDGIRDMKLCHKEKRDFNKWKYLDQTLANGIYRLSNHERGETWLYAGMRGVFFDKANGCGYFSTFQSASEKRDVAVRFGAHDFELKFHPSMRERSFCCDISWISAYPQEHEVIFKRATQFYARIEDEKEQKVQVHNHVNSKRQTKRCQTILLLPVRSPKS